MFNLYSFRGNSIFESFIWWRPAGNAGNVPKFRRIALHSSEVIQIQTFQQNIAVRRSSRKSNRNERSLLARNTRSFYDGKYSSTRKNMGWAFSVFIINYNSVLIEPLAVSHLQIFWSNTRHFWCPKIETFENERIFFKYLYWFFIAIKFLINYFEAIFLYC